MGSWKLRRHCAAAAEAEAPASSGEANVRTLTRTLASWTKFPVATRTRSALFAFQYHQLISFARSFVCPPALCDLLLLCKLCAPSAPARRAPATDERSCRRKSAAQLSALSGVGIDQHPAERVVLSHQSARHVSSRRQLKFMRPLSRATAERNLSANAARRAEPSLCLLRGAAADAHCHFWRPLERLCAGLIVGPQAPSGQRASQTSLALHFRPTKPTIGRGLELGRAR